MIATLILSIYRFKILQKKKKKKFTSGKRHGLLAHWLRYIYSEVQVPACAIVYLNKQVLVLLKHKT